MAVDLDFDPDGPATGDGLFGLPHSPDEAEIVVMPVPWELTTSYHRGTARGPARVLEGSAQVDLFLPEAPQLWRRGIALLPVDPTIEALHAEALPHALAVVEAEDPTDPALDADRDAVNAASAALDARVEAQIGALFDQGKIPAVLGGDHSVPLGAIAAAVARHPDVGVLHIDAHADLRDAYMGFRGSHASILHNVLAQTPVQRVVQVGIRDYGHAEFVRMTEDDRIVAYTWEMLARGLSDGLRWSSLANRIIGSLPDKVWITFDIDGLDPVLCPATGTPVPGGLSWDQTLRLLAMLRECGKQVIGFDLVEVGDGTYDGNVGARLLYRMCAIASTTRPR